VITNRVSGEHWRGLLRSLVEEHHAETGSVLAGELLRNWDAALPRFWQVCPKEMVGRLDHALEAEEAVHHRA
jgi:glutamate synthase (NADPH/NADH) large chain